MPTREEYDVHSALYEEAFALYEAAKADFQALEKVIREQFPRDLAPLHSELSDEEASRTRLFLARLRLSRSRMRLTSDDLALAAEGCRALAERYRDNAKQYDDATIKDVTLVRAHRAERLGEFFELERDRVRERMRSPAEI